MNLKLMLIWAMAVILAIYGRSEDSEAIPLIPAGGPIVQARVMKVAMRDNGIDLVLKIERVFVGDPGVIGQTFSVETYFMDLRGTFTIGQQTVEGESSIWRVGQKLKDKVWGHEMESLRSTVALPVFEHQGVAFRNARGWARTVAEISKLSAAEQSAALWEVAASASNAISQRWAIRLLGQDKQSETITRFREFLLSGKPPVGVQVVLDEVLCARLGLEWAHDEARTAILVSWAAAAHDVETEQRFLLQIENSCEERELNDEQLSRIKAVLEANPHLSPIGRKLVSLLKIPPPNPVQPEDPPREATP